MYICWQGVYSGIQQRPEKASLRKETLSQFHLKLGLITAMVTENRGGAGRDRFNYVGAAVREDLSALLVARRGPSRRRRFSSRHAIQAREALPLLHGRRIL